MQGPLSTGLDYYRAVLDLRGYRQQVLSADIANASTPGFKAVDLDFNKALAAAVSGATPGGTPGQGTPPSSSFLLVDDPRHIGGGDAGGTPAQGSNAVQSQVKYQTGGQVTVDGNSVDLDYEKRQAAINALQYEAAATFTTSRVNMLMTAIRGSSSGSTSNG